MRLLFCRDNCVRLFQHNRPIAASLRQATIDQKRSVRPMNKPENHLVRRPFLFRLKHEFRYRNGLSKHLFCRYLVTVRPSHLPNSSIKGDGVRVFLSERDHPYR